MTVTTHYENSPNNRANPDSNRTVYWGDQAWEEMMSPFFAVIAGKSVDTKKIITTPHSVRPGAWRVRNHPNWFSRGLRR